MELSRSGLVWAQPWGLLGPMTFRKLLQDWKDRAHPKAGCEQGGEIARVVLSTGQASVAKCSHVAGGHQKDSGRLTCTALK